MFVAGLANGGDQIIPSSRMSLVASLGNRSIAEMAVEPIVCCGSSAATGDRSGPVACGCAALRLCFKFKPSPTAGVRPSGRGKS